MNEYGPVCINEDAFSICILSPFFNEHHPFTGPQCSICVVCDIIQLSVYREKNLKQQYEYGIEELEEE